MKRVLFIAGFALLSPIYLFAQTYLPEKVARGQYIFRVEGGLWMPQS